MPLPCPQQRLALRDRPTDQRQLMWQQWKDLLFLNWRWDAAEIQKRLPPGLFVDTFDGAAWVGFVPFFIRGVRFKGLPPVPRVSDFMELNVRTYVHDESGRAGVWFFSLEAASALAVWVGHKFYSLPYHQAAMRYGRDGDGWISHFSKRQGEFCINRYRRLEPLPQPDPESLEFFLIERYGFFCLHKKKLRFVRVHHVPYELWNVQVEAVNKPLFAMTGLQAPASPFDHAAFSPGVTVRIYPMQAVT